MSPGGQQPPPRQQKKVAGQQVMPPGAAGKGHWRVRSAGQQATAWQTLPASQQIPVPPVNGFEESEQQTAVSGQNPELPQLTPHWPPWQISPLGQQAPLQSTRPLGQAQVPDWQVLPPVQASPQAEQCWLEPRVTQAPLHETWPVGQPVGPSQRPLTTVWPLGQAQAPLMQVWPGIGQSAEQQSVALMQVVPQSFEPVGHSQRPFWQTLPEAH
jgi:hypothetical protein